MIVHYIEFQSRQIVGRDTESEKKCEKNEELDRLIDFLLIRFNTFEIPFS